MTQLELRAQLGQTLDGLMSTDSRIVVVNADLANANGTAALQVKYPDRFFNVGVQEANMASFAAGMATYGYIPFIVTFAPFATRRIADQLMVSIAYAGTNVKIIGGDPGVTAELNGGTHMTFEDVAITRSMAGMMVVEPCDGTSLASLLPQIVAYDGPVYMRMYRKLAPVVHRAGTVLNLMRAEIVRSGRDVSLIASGIEVQQALQAAELLAHEGIEADVLDVHTIKPLDTETILASVTKTGAAVTCENHNIMGGLGSAVAELTAEKHPVRLGRIGSQDRLGQVGKLPFLLEEYRLSAPHIAAKAREVLSLNAFTGSAH